MWRARILRRARRLLTSQHIQIGAAVSLMVAADRQQRLGEEVQLLERGCDVPAAASFLLNKTYCDGGWNVFSLLSKRSTNMQRRRTIQKMIDSSEKEKLESKYRVDWKRALGEGAFGAVYRGEPVGSGEAVAVKKIPKKMTNNVSFHREIENLMHLRKNGGHPNICGLHENFDEDEHYYLILDLISGGEMFDHLVAQGPYSEADAARLVREVASALAWLHGIGCVHGDLKPENLMLSSENPLNAVIKIVDFGCAQIIDGKDEDPQDRSNLARTPAYCPPEILEKNPKYSNKLHPSFDMFALGVIVYIMLTGCHPFDTNGNSTDEQIKKRITSRESPPLRNTRLTKHLSASSIELIEQLMQWDPEKRLTALDMLNHPWVRGETALSGKIAGSDERLSHFHHFKSRIERKVFEDLVAGLEDVSHGDVVKRTCLLEKSFNKMDPHHKGYITDLDLRKLTEPDKEKSPLSSLLPFADFFGFGKTLSLSGFTDLLSDNMKNRYYPKGHIVYKEGDEGNCMYFINSGTIEVATKDGHTSTRHHGDSFGEGALLHPQKIRSATIRCVTPVHAIEISREYFEKYLSDGSDLKLNLREKDKTRKRLRAKTILRLQQNMTEKTFPKGSYLFRVGEEGKHLYIMEEGTVDVRVEDRTVFQVKPGAMCGEHSLIFNRPRNTSALCVSDECKALVMEASDFNEFMESSPSSKESLRDMCLRREFQKALVFKTKKPFPTNERALREAFDAAGLDASKGVTLENIRSMLKNLDPTFSDADIREILKSLDLSETGNVSFEEFKRIFGMADK